MKSDADLTSLGFETRAIHAGQAPEGLTGAVSVPIFQTSTYAQEALGKPYQGIYEYARTENPTRKALETCIASLEGGEYGLAFSSGLAATNNLMNLLKAGDHVIVGDDVYGGTYRLFTRVFEKFGLTFDFVDTADAAALESRVRPNTRMLWIETPTNPLLKLTDLEAAAAFCRRHNLISVVDNTFMSPYNQRPLEAGIDIVVHSATKYLGGHSDVVLGLMATRSKEIFENQKFHQNAVGAVCGPFDAFLVMRGLKTLAVRMERHAANATILAGLLSAHEGVERVYYPGLPSDPQHALAKRQMRTSGGMISFVVRGGLEAARAFMESLKIFTLAESLGGVESLADHPAIMTHASIPPARRAELGITDGLVRLSVGIESIDDLRADVTQALEAAARVAGRSAASV
ncbi:MAG: cystathionine gamma-synthase [Proteobacteria bacterium]|nr:cystathionine gamma-synthase [Pseudomonadota bacterium]